MLSHPALQAALMTLSVELETDPDDPAFQEAAHDYFDHVRDVLDLSNADLQRILDKGKTTIHRWINEGDEIPRGAVDSLTRYHLAHLRQDEVLRDIIHGELTSGIRADVDAPARLPDDMETAFFYLAPTKPESTQ